MPSDSSRLLRTAASWCLFVDGENFTKRGQEVLAAADVTPDTGTHWKRDTYLWLPGTSVATSAYTLTWSSPNNPGPPPAVRAYFYSSMNTGEPEWTSCRLALRELGFEPRLFPRRRGRSKAVDIALATDVLTLAYEGRYEVAVLVAGDGDYVPLVEAVKRVGQHVVVAFFAENGLSPELRIAADEFVDLTPAVVNNWRSWQADEAKRRKAAELKAR